MREFDHALRSPGGTRSSGCSKAARAWRGTERCFEGGRECTGVMRMGDQRFTMD